MNDYVYNSRNSRPLSVQYSLHSSRATSQVSSSNALKIYRVRTDNILFLDRKCMLEQENTYLL